MVSFTQAVVAAGLSQSVVAEMAGAALLFMEGFDQRCMQLNNGTLPQLRRPAATIA